MTLLKFNALQLLFTGALSVWLGYRIFHNTLFETHLWVLIGPKAALLCDYSEDGLSDDNGHEARMCTQMNKQDNEDYYQISSRSRCTQLCIFLMLESRQGNVIDLVSGPEVTNNEHITARAATSTILFKWQTTESDYRALAAAITQNIKRAA